MNELATLSVENEKGNNTMWS